MPRFVAVYTMKPEDLARFRAMPEAEQKTVDAVGLKQWVDWEKANAASFPDTGGMVGSGSYEGGKLHHDCSLNVLSF